MISLPGPRCVRNAEHGSVALGLALGGLVLALGLAVGVVGAAAAAYVAATSAADAAALAAAPVTFAPFGARGTPSQEASRFAAMNGAVLVRCTCAPDPSFEPRTVTVQVERRLRLPGLGTVRVRASSRATFEPARLIP